MAILIWSCKDLNAIPVRLVVKVYGVTHLNISPFSRVMVDTIKPLAG